MSVNDQGSRWSQLSLKTGGKVIQGSSMFHNFHIIFHSTIFYVWIGTFINKEWDSNFSSLFYGLCYDITYHDFPNWHHGSELNECVHMWWLSHLRSWISMLLILLLTIHNEWFKIFADVALVRFILTIFHLNPNQLCKLSWDAIFSLIQCNRNLPHEWSENSLVSLKTGNHDRKKRSSRASLTSHDH